MTSSNCALANELLALCVLSLDLIVQRTLSVIFAEQAGHELSQEYIYDSRALYTSLTKHALGRLVLTSYCQAGPKPCC